MLSLLALFLIGSAASSTTRGESPNGYAFNMGMAVSALAETKLWRNADGVVGVPFEITLLQHNDRFWMGTGLSWQFGTSAVATDTRIVNANILGLHGDLGFSLLAFDHVDLKMGIGPALRYVSIDRGDWFTGTYDDPGYDLPETHQSRILVTIRATTSLLFHRPGRSGGLELIPIRLEYGPSMFQISPCFSVSKFF